MNEASPAIAPAGGEAAALRSLIRDLVESSKLPAKRRTGDIKQTVGSLTSLAYEKGLLAEDLDALVDLVTTPSHLDQASIAAVVRNLYPVSNVSSDSTLKVVGSLGHGQLKPSLNVQSLLLRWLIMVYHILGSQSTLSQTYSVLFNLLDTAALRPQLSHLLALITRRKHVRPYRIQTILALSRQIGSDPGLKGLLRVYKDYYPEIIVGEAAKGRAAAFKHPDKAWRTRLDEIQEAHLNAAHGSSAAPRPSFRVARQSVISAKLGKGASLPPVRTLHAQESSVTLEEIEDVDKFVQNLDKIELPNQLVACLADPLLQKLMQLRPDESNYQRASAWVASFSQDVLDGEVDNAHLRDMLEIVRDYAAHMKMLPDVFQDFILELFKLRGIGGDRFLVLDIMSYTKFRPWEIVYPTVLQPLEAAVLDNTPKSQVALLRFYTSLLQNWTVPLLSANGGFPKHTQATISGLLEHVRSLCLTISQTGCSAATQGHMLSFYEQTFVLLANPKLADSLRIVIPPAQFVYTLAFSPSLATVSRLCAVLAAYKRGFEHAMPARGTGTASATAKSYDRAYVNVFNGYLMDICNCLWRARAFNKTDTNAAACMMPDTVVQSLTAYLAQLGGTSGAVAAAVASSPGPSAVATGGGGVPLLTSAFALSHSPMLCLQSIASVRTLEDREHDADPAKVTARHAGPVTQDSLARLEKSGGVKLSWQEYRLGVLTYLEERGIGGIPALMYNTMKILMNKKGPATPGTEAAKAT